MLATALRYNLLQVDRGLESDELGTSPNRVRLARAKGQHGKIGHRSRFARIVKMRARAHLKLGHSARTQWRVSFSIGSRAAAEL
jgi:hypothetical protein